MTAAAVTPSPAEPEADRVHPPLQELLPFQEGALAPALVKAAGGPDHLALHKQKGTVKPYCRLC
eukprot:1912918-Lingulodinium_polyedra.AAC.1